MPDISPATCAIVAAFDDRYELCGPFDDNWQELCLAAALRAAADLERSNPWGARIECAGAMWMRDQLLAIAAELEGGTSTKSTH